ncbi:MAG: transporter related [Firmicutes bacterium]|nr:transporter related [Bacillota bacterium]
MITIKQLYKTYDTGVVRVEALKNVDLEVPEGQFLAIMGPSGSGKSTLMNILGCLDKPSTGDYILDGVDVKSQDEKQLSKVRNQKIGFVFQTFNLLPRLDCVRNVALPMLYAGISSTYSKEHSLAALDKVGLLDHARHRPNELSGGQRQRVAIARALVNDPRIILADEPTGNLDTRSGIEVMALFEELHQQGRTIVLVTHEPEIANHAQKIIHFRDGRLVKSEQVANPVRAAQQLAELDEAGEVAE